MPSTPSAPPKIAYRHNDARERHEIGVRVGKLFVPFVTLDDARYAQLVEHAENTNETEEAGAEEPE